MQVGFARNQPGSHRTTGGMAVYAERDARDSLNQPPTKWGSSSSQGWAQRQCKRLHGPSHGAQQHCSARRASPLTPRVNDFSILVTWVHPAIQNHSSDKKGEQLQLQVELNDQSGRWTETGAASGHLLLTPQSPPCSPQFPGSAPSQQWAAGSRPSERSLYLPMHQTPAARCESP